MREKRKRRSIVGYTLVVTLCLLGAIGGFLRVEHVTGNVLHGSGYRTEPSMSYEKLHSTVHAAQAVLPPRLSAVVHLLQAEEELLSSLLSNII